MSQEAKKLYDALKESEQLGPGMTGKWLQDKDRFIRQYEEDQKFLNGFADFSSVDEDDDWP